jgi:hypothetical protein
MLETKPIKTIIAIFPKSPGANNLAKIILNISPINCIPPVFIALQKKAETPFDLSESS